MCLYRESGSGQNNLLLGLSDEVLCEISQLVQAKNYSTRKVVRDQLLFVSSLGDVFLISRQSVLEPYDNTVTDWADILYTI